MAAIALFSKELHRLNMSSTVYEAINYSEGLVSSFTGAIAIYCAHH